MMIIYTYIIGYFFDLFLRLIYFSRYLLDARMIYCVEYRDIFAHYLSA